MRKFQQVEEKDKEVKSWQDKENEGLSLLSNA